MGKENKYLGNMFEYVHNNRLPDLDFSPGSTVAMLMAHGSYNPTPMHIEGTDSVIVKP
jgi:hypothetical protein